MKYTTLFTLFTSALISTSVYANSSFTDTAQITAIESIYREHTIQKPYQDCYIQSVYQPESQGDGSATNELFGGLIGGAIGNQFGRGSGKDAMTVAGALLGASIANDSEQTTSGRYVDQRICETKYDNITENRLSHYQVGYTYQDEQYSFKSQIRPTGDTLKVRVNVNPLVN